MLLKTILAIITMAALIPMAHGGLLAYGVCQAGCAAVVVACYSVAGFTFGVALPVVPPALLVCNAAFGKCQAACAVVALAPTP